MNKVFRKIIFSFLLVFSFSFSGNTQIPLPDHIELSDSSYIALLTCAPGFPLYSTFGHSAIGVFDYHKRLQLVFNYGTFSFNTPNFYLKFAAGKLNYKLSVSTYKRFLREYQRTGRMVVEERFNLTADQKQDVLDALLENYKPENREYMYDFFFDNCATRNINILELALGDSLKYHVNEANQTQTFRNLIDEYLIDKHWSDFGIDIALGSIIDKLASEKQKTFLPDYLSNYCSNCTVGNNPLIGDTKIIVQDTTNFPKLPFILKPFVVFTILFLVILTLSLLYRNKSWLIADKIIFSTYGLLGINVLLLWLATNHDATAGNLNFLWANPLYIIYVFYLSGNNIKLEKWLTIFFLFMSVAVLVTWNINPQKYHVAFIPMIGLIIVRLTFRTLRSWKE